METYIYKMMALSAVFILLYFVFLEKEKNHHFKRFYLLLSILFSMLVPFISIDYGTIEVVETINQNNSELIILPETKLVETTVFTLENILFGIYILGFTLLFLKFSLGIYKLIKEINSSEKIKQNHYQFILKQNKITPYSFWNSIFINKKDFLEGKIDSKIILHEKAHINQRHSIDVLFIEIMLCVFWFNPALYLYKKAVMTNHEFLADEAVIRQNQDIESYQKLILNELISEKILFTHPFNLHNTKKRIVMMTHKITKIAKLKSYLTLPISALLFFAFVEKVPAKVELKKTNLTTIPTRENVFQKADNQNITDKKNLLSKEKLMIEKDTIKPKRKFIKKDTLTPPPPPPSYPHPKSKVKIKNNDIPPPPPVEKIESQTPAEFPGGMMALRQKFIENFETSKLQYKKGTIKGNINFIISEDGKNYNASYDFDDEDFKKAAKSAMEKSLNGVVWKPGTLNGKPASSSLRMPMSMIFE